jgi:hypothetical protein
MKTYYICENSAKSLKYIHRDGTSTTSSHCKIDAIFKASNISEMLSKLAEFCNCEPSDAVLNNCVNGWVSFIVPTRMTGEKLTIKEMQDFKNGLIDIYEDIYVFYVEEVISNPVKF